MSIICHEDQQPLFISEQAFAVTTEEIPGYTTICEDHYSLIPQDGRIKGGISGGVDVHFLFARASGLSELTSDPMFDTLSLRNVELGDYRFSISRELASTILPASLEYILALEGRR